MSYESHKYKNTFVFNQNINNIISLYFDKKNLKQSPECIVCLYNGPISYSTATNFTKLIIKLAGEDLIHDLIKKTKDKNSSHIGGIIVTQAFKYPANHLLHVVAPTYVPKYANAAYSKLHFLYQHIFSLAVELNSESIGIACLHRINQGFVGTEGARIALRTIRRFLESSENSSSLKKIILIIPKKSDQLIYSELMPVYFPCKEFMENMSLDIKERQLNEDNNQQFFHDRDIQIQPTIFSSLQDLSTYKSCDFIDKSFLRMKTNFDHDRIQSLRRHQKMTRKFVKQKMSLNTQLSATTLDEFANPRMLYRGGKDAFGSHVVVFVALHFPKKYSHSFPIWFTNRLIDIINENYSLVYLQTSATWIPTTECLKKFWSQIDQRFLKNISKIYVLHADRSAQMKCWLSLPGQIYKHLKFVRGIEDLYAYIPSHQITMPNHVLDYDFKINGLRYYAGPVADLPS